MISEAETNLEQLRLRVPEAEFDLVDGGLVFEWVCGQVLYPKEL